MSFNLATMLRESAQAHPERACVRFLGSSVTYGEVDERSTTVAANLLGSGLRRGDTVAISLPNVPEFLYAYFGALKAGLVVLPMNPLLKAPEITYLLEDASAKVLIAFELFLDEAVGATAGDPDIGHYLVPLPGSTPTLPEGVLPFDELLAPAKVDEVAGDIVPTNADDTAVLLYTSGTTGRPKGAELTHFQLFMNCTVAGETFGVEDGDVTLAVLPLFHVFGLSSVCNVTIRFGGTLSLVPRFEVGPVLDAMEADGVTVFLGVPTMYVALLAEDISARDLSKLRVASSGGASIPGEVLRAFEERFGVPVLEGYGLSETASAACFNRLDARRVLSIGKPMWGVDMRIVDEEDRPLPPGSDHAGEVVIRGHNVMKSYLNLPEETEKAMRNGWFHTGDIGYQDEDGFYFIVDRIKDLVIRGGYNVYPREIEEVLYTHPDVLEAAVIGRPDERMGEEVVAAVTLKPGATATPEALIAFCKERLAAYKYPREVRLFAELPKNATGKVLKTELRAGW